ncbi:hypothetical protein [Kribbella shirazensis]|uniref:Uncharacterized protein n=1 Tax=Kribbella shirazensis TaxID=1105143 RepID=A0A7X5V7W3_9ACTN|nr:hypothetical protein [Kribbella shirazensis]NIK56248.1 hypothetical protein [Kribbella shirazensis]
MARGFTDEMDAYGAQYVSRYPNAATARAAYNSIIATPDAGDPLVRQARPAGGGEAHPLSFAVGCDGRGG